MSVFRLSDLQADTKVMSPNPELKEADATTGQKILTYQHIFFKQQQNISECAFSIFTEQIKISSVTVNNTL